MEIFGFEIKRKQRLIKSFTTPENNDGSIISNEGPASGYFTSEGYDFDSKVRSDAQLINHYRKISQDAEIDIAIDDIINEAISYDESQDMVSIILDDIKDVNGMSNKIKKLIEKEFVFIYDLLNFQNTGYEIFKHWYVDGRIAFHIAIDTKNPKAGIQELRYIDPRKIKKIKKIIHNDTNDLMNTSVEEYFLFSKDFGSFDSVDESLKISKDSVAFITSGLMNGNRVISYIHKAIKPLNQLRILEDATIIYKVTRAPERRIFYINVGDLPKAKAEQYLKQIMNRHKNKIVYNSVDGTVTNSKKIMAMNEDFWLPRNSDGRGTEIDSLPGGTGLGEIDDLVFFQRKLYRALNVPSSRMDTEATFNVGRSSEITRDEIKFTKFIVRLRNKFSELFSIILEKQLLLKGIITSDDWKLIKNKIKYRFSDDSHFSELKNSEVMRARMEDASSAEEFIGAYLSRGWVYRNILKFTEKEVVDIKKEIVTEKKSGDIETDLDSDGVADTIDPDVGNDGTPDSKQQDQPES